MRSAQERELVNEANKLDEVVWRTAVALAKAYWSGKIPRSVIPRQKRSQLFAVMIEALAEADAGSWVPTAKKVIEERDATKK